MVEEDPDKEAYYEMGGSGSNIPVRIYRVMDVQQNLLHVLQHNSTVAIYKEGFYIISMSKTFPPNLMAMSPYKILNIE